MPDDLSPTAVQALERIRAILSSARNQALQAVNSVMLSAYWDIGREVTEEEQRGSLRADYGIGLVRALSKQLTKEFGKGFTPRNLWFMRDFYQTFPKVNALRTELSWTHYRLLLKVKREDARSFYIEESIRARWSTRELERQVNSFLFERLLKSPRQRQGSVSYRAGSGGVQCCRSCARPLRAGVHWLARAGRMVGERSRTGSHESAAAILARTWS